MKKIEMKMKAIFLVWTLILMCSCYEDKGNYSYSEQAVITIDNLPESVTLTQKVDYLSLEPIVKSSVEGVISADNPNFEFGCRLYKNSGTFSSDARWIDINEEKAQKVNFLANVDADAYTAWYTVTDKRSGITTNFTVNVNVKTLSGTDEGWMVLCNTGTENRVRLDMISVLAGNEKKTIHDIWNSDAPQLRNANRIMFDARLQWNGGDFIWVSTADGSYRLDAGTLQMTAANNLTNSFLVNIGNQLPVYTEAVPVTGRFAITNEGNLYYQELSVSSSFTFPINTFTEYHDPEFKLAPAIGTTLRRISEVETIKKALLYDQDNKRFIGWDEEKGTSTCFVLPDPESDKLFSYQTGRDLVAMVNTTFGTSTVYSILKDHTGKQYVYGVNLGDKFVQTYYKQIATEGFEQADKFAFYSTAPYLFYSHTNKVYCYHLFESTISQPLTLEDEEITLIKFNPFQIPQNRLTNSSDEFWQQQNYLIVGSYKKNATNENEGILRFYKFDSDSKTLTKVSEYTGFAKIKDVVYRERGN